MCIQLYKYISLFNFCIVSFPMACIYVFMYACLRLFFFSNRIFINRCDWSDVLHEEQARVTYTALATYQKPKRALAIQCGVPLRPGGLPRPTRPWCAQQGCRPHDHAITITTQWWRWRGWRWIWNYSRYFRKALYIHTQHIPVLHTVAYIFNSQYVHTYKQYK